MAAAEIAGVPLQPSIFVQVAALLRLFSLMILSLPRPLLFEKSLPHITFVESLRCMMGWQVLGRGIVYVLLETLFPVLFGLVAFPMAQVIGAPPQPSHLVSFLLPPRLLSAF
eukprot:1976843-Rhodomonas_salina.2